jgi:hypothetical protein
MRKLTHHRSLIARIGFIVLKVRYIPKYLYSRYLGRVKVQFKDNGDVFVKKTVNKADALKTS